jgi:RHS repeat-associated protein
VCEGQGGCVNVLWPAPIRGAYHQGDATGGDWVGSLVPGMQDASGLLYKRNRYYNPQTGQFTQPDPIGIAGGLNTYGFAEGDPVSFDDPYGHCPKTLRLAPAAAVDGPVPAVDGLLALSCLVESASIGWRLWRGARTAQRLLSEPVSDADIPAAQGLPDLTGQTQEEADATLEGAGFSKQRNTGSYQRYTHEDGSQVSIGPDGRVVRQGPLVQSGPNARSYRRRYGPDGKQIEHNPSGSNTHNTGEVIRGPQP